MTLMSYLLLFGWYSNCNGQEKLSKKKLVRKKCYSQPQKHKIPICYKYNIYGIKMEVVLNRNNT